MNNADDICRLRAMWERDRTDCIHSAIIGSAFGIMLLILTGCAISLAHVSPLFVLGAMACAFSGTWLIVRAIPLAIAAVVFSRNLHAMKEDRL